MKEAGYECLSAGNSCTEICGDGLIIVQETKTKKCDDGNLRNKDGCSSECEI